MGIEAIAILLSFMGAAMLLLLVGRLFWLVLKIALVAIFLWLVLSRVVPNLKPSVPKKGTLAGAWQLIHSTPAADRASRWAQTTPHARSTDEPRRRRALPEP